MSSDEVKIGNVLYPSSDVGSLIAFYGDGLGLAVKFRDGDRFAALDAGGVTLALAGPDEDVTAGVVAASFKVADVAAAVANLEERGAAVLQPPAKGPHEVRAVLRDPAGNTFVIYGPR